MVIVSHLQLSEFIRDHLIQQNALSEDGLGIPECRYRLGGLSCAIGCLIPDGRYTEELEGKSLSALFESDQFSDVFSRTLSGPMLDDLCQQGLAYTIMYRWQNYHDAHQSDMIRGGGYKTWLDQGGATPAISPEDFHVHIVGLITLHQYAQGVYA